MSNLKLTKKQQEYKSATEHEYQSSFMPIFSHAETQIKKMIAKFFWQAKSKRLLLETIKEYVKTIDEKIPKDLPNRQAYIDGLWKSSQRMVDKYYTKAFLTFTLTLAVFSKLAKKKKVVIGKITNPKELTETLQKDKVVYGMWEQAKGYVRIQQYSKEIENYINGLSEETIKTYQKGFQPISLWQKAELDVRYGHQMKMLQDIKDKGIDLCWISTHPNCSKRCERWQGALVSLSLPSKYSGFRVMKVDGHWVYSLTEIMAQKDKYGYANNIICGFNCRHYLKPYTPNSQPPKQYEDKDVERMRKVEALIRKMEREIRALKRKAILLEQNGKIKEAKKCLALAKVKTNKLMALCNKEGFAFQKYRITI